MVRCAYFAESHSSRLEIPRFRGRSAVVTIAHELRTRLGSSGCIVLVGFESLSFRQYEFLEKKFVQHLRRDHGLPQWRPTNTQRIDLMVGRRESNPPRCALRWPAGHVSNIDRCCFHKTGTPRMSLCKVRPSGCRPSKIASTISGARNESCMIRLR